MKKAAPGKRLKKVNRKEIDSDEEPQEPIPTKKALLKKPAAKDYDDDEAFDEDDHSGEFNNEDIYQDEEEIPDDA